MGRTPEQHRENRDKAAIASREASTHTRDIGAIPVVSKPRRRAKCRRDLRKFIETYCPPSDFRAWSPSHLRCIAIGQRSVLEGGLFAFALPRGSGKTTLCERLALWALLYGHRRFVMCIGADAPAAAQTLDAISKEIEHNDLLLEDFPEVCFPVRALEGIHHRANGQTVLGVRTRMRWTRDLLNFPTVKGSKTSGSVVRVAGITGRIRGAKVAIGGGISLRPDLVIVDDPQTDESARSVSQTISRERILNGAILGLAGPGAKISGIMPCTVICPGDMADSVLDRRKWPQWQGERVSMLTTLPTNDKLWDQYSTLRSEGLRTEVGLSLATEFYRENQAGMDAGAEAYWKHRFNADEASAVQHAMNLKLSDEQAFWAEYQNKPLAVTRDTDILISAAAIQDKINRIPRGVVPYGVSTVTAFIDVQQDCLWYLAAGWQEDFTGHVLDYGCYPDQGMQYVLMRDIRTRLRDRFPGSIEGAIYQGAEELAKKLQERIYTSVDGNELRCSTIMVDASWGASTDSIYQLARATGIIPSHGRYVGAMSLPFQFYKHKPGDKFGLNWHMPIGGVRRVRYVLYDTNAWKTFIHSRLVCQVGEHGSLSLFGDSPSTHRMIAQHLVAETRLQVESRGRTVDEWKLPTNRPDNHLFDCLVGAAVGASINGCILLDATRADMAAERKQADNRKRYHGVKL